MRKLSRRSWIALALTAGLVASLGGAVGASADTGVTHSGAYGVHYLADSAEYAGVRCTYNNSSVISSIRVRDPFVFAKSTTTGVDTQWVSWFFRIQKQTVGSTLWTDVVTSATQKRTATDGQIANFSPITRAFTGSAANQYRVVVVIRWYGPGGTTIIGRTTHRADWYSWVGVPSFKGLCPGGIF